MAADEDQPRSGVSRRDALRLLAASTTTVAAGSLIISQPAFAANGSVACGYEFNKTPTMTLKLKNQSGTKTDSLSISVGNTVGKCKCSGRASVEYAYYVEIPGKSPNLGNGTGSIGWITSKDASVSSPSVLWPDMGGQLTVSVGVRVTCPGTNGPVVQCWYGTAIVSVGPANWNSSPSFQLTVNNSSNNPPGIPPCSSSALRSSQLAAPGSITLVPGLLPDTIDAIGDQPTVDLGAVDPSTTTSSTTTTTTTDKPGNGPKPSATTSTTTTSSTPSTSTTTSTTSTSTTTPPSTTTPGG